MLFSLYFYKREKRILFIILAGITGAIHRPTFYIFGLTYFVFSLISYKKLKDNIINGVLILAIFFSFYVGRYWEAITRLFEPVLKGFVQSGEAPGTFINFFTYQFSILTYLPFALIGLFYLIKKKDFNLLVVWAILNLIIVYFQFFFFNRFIIMLDVVLVILAAAGFSLVIQNNKKAGAIITILLIVSAGVLAFQDSINSKPLIDNEELNTIEYLQNTEENSFVMVTSSIYSPWVLGYSGRRTIAPGLFDYNLHNESEWNNFWKTESLTEVKGFMNSYQKPLYIFIGKQQSNNLEKFSECFTEYYRNNDNIIYEYVC